MSRRNSERFNVDIPCSLTIGSDFFKGTIKDMSEDGIAFRLNISDSGKLKESLRGSSVIRFEAENISGKCRVVRMDMLGVINAVLVAGELINRNGALKDDK